MDGPDSGKVRLLLDVKVEVRSVNPDQDVGPSGPCDIARDELPEGENGRELLQDLRKAHDRELVD